MIVPYFLRLSRMTSLVAAATLASAVLTPLEAEACSCGGDVTAWPMPSLRAPTNTNVWLRKTWFSLPILSARLVTSSGGAVQTTSIENSEFFILDPVEDLVGGETYEVRQTMKCSDGPCQETWTFAVAGSADLEAPPVPSLVSRTEYVSVPEVENSDDCEVITSFEKLNFGHWPTSSKTVLIAAQAGEDGTPMFDPLTRRGDIDYSSFGGSISVGFGHCTNWFNDQPPDEEGEVHGELVFGALDLAGNFSGWSDPFVIDLAHPDALRVEEGDGVGCTSAGGGSPWSAFTLLALLVLAWRRRRAAHLAGVAAPG